MQIFIGADELILWLRKNNKATGIENITLGRKIVKLIQQLGGEPKVEDHLSLWSNDMSDDAMFRLGIPKTSEQYLIETSILPAIYDELFTW